MIVSNRNDGNKSNMLGVKPTNHRGAFIVFEGVDRCGKTTQVSLLVKHLLQVVGIAAVSMRFPDRTTPSGLLINQYLQSKSDLDDRAIHLLFSANRWEVAPNLRQHLLDGTTVVCDRYAYSGVAFSSAKPNLSNELQWCQSCDVGLPAPDAVIFLDISQEQAEKRGGYGGERYEKKEMQTRVRERFAQLQAQDEDSGMVPWFIVDAAQSIDQVQHDINDAVQKTLDKVQTVESLPIQDLWRQKYDDSSDNNKEN